LIFSKKKSDKIFSRSLSLKSSNTGFIFFKAKAKLQKSNVKNVLLKSLSEKKFLAEVSYLQDFSWFSMLKNRIIKKFQNGNKDA